MLQGNHSLLIKIIDNISHLTNFCCFSDVSCGIWTWIEGKKRVKFKNLEKEDNNLKNCVTRIEQVGKKHQKEPTTQYKPNPAEKCSLSAGEEGQRQKSPLQDGLVIRKQNKSISGPILSLLKYYFGGICLFPASRVLTQVNDITTSCARTRWCRHLSSCFPHEVPPFVHLGPAKLLSATGRISL